MYQGHHHDGSSIQRHSAGPLYPFVLYIHEVNGKRFWCVLGPGIDTSLMFSSFDEAEHAARRLLAVRESDDAWAFELERLCKVADSKLAQMQVAARSVANSTGTHLYSSMSKAARVRSLIELGRAWNSLRLLFVPAPTFALIAKHLEPA